MSELPTEYLVAVNEFMAMIARGQEPTRRVSRDCGYDVHALQACMDVAGPHLALLQGYKPLALWLRETSDIHIVSEQDPGPYKSVLRVIRLFVKTNIASDKVHSYQAVDVYVNCEGQYIVTILENPTALRQDLYTKERIVRIIECKSARDIAVVLNPMRLQADQYGEFREDLCVTSPSMYVARRLSGMIQARTRKHEAELSNLRIAVKGLVKATEL